MTVYSSGRQKLLKFCQLVKLDNETLFWFFKTESQFGIKLSSILLPQLPNARIINISHQLQFWKTLSQVFVSEPAAFLSK